MSKLDIFISGLFDIDTPELKECLLFNLNKINQSIKKERHQVSIFYHPTNQIIV